MSEMIERVAREIAHQRAIRMVEDNGGDPLRIKAWNTNARDFQDAAAAIKAMREPTMAMLNAAVDRTGAGSDMSWSNRSPQGLFETGLQAMIDAALVGEG